MALHTEKRTHKGRNVLYTIAVSLLLCGLFLGLVAILYNSAKEEAYESLHIQTKQIKDDISLQIRSDRENLATMANFAAKLYRDGDDYQLLFDAFNPIGLIANIGVLNPDNTFVTKAGSINLDGKISFEEEAQKGAYISGRVADLTKEGNELVRSAVPITADNKVVGILYGVITIDNIKNKYDSMAKELDAQLFVYGKDTGDLIIDTVHEKLGNISFLKDREYLENYTYEQIVTTDKGYSSFKSVYRDENVHMHYSTIEELDWMIAMVRYDSQVFANMNTLVQTLFTVFGAMVVIIAIYVLILMQNERQTNMITACASDVRKTLLETAGNRQNIAEALKQVCHFAKSRSAIFFDTNGEDYHYIANNSQKVLISDAKQSFMAEIVRYTTEHCNHPETEIRVVHLKTNNQLRKINPQFHALLQTHDIRDIIFSATVSHANHITILCVINPRRRTRAANLAEKVAACFAIAQNNHTVLNKTRLAATTDSLTGALNRVAYNQDLHIINEEKPLDFSCIYVDVNELHWRNNNFGHAAGDEMLLYIAHTLQDVFFGHKVYRLGGDEFLVFCPNTNQDDVKKGIALFLEQLKSRDYHVAIGMSFRSQNTNSEEMVREAEIRMYEAKAKYYQNKEQQRLVSRETEFVQIQTGIAEIDTMLSILKESYNGIYRVSLDTDKARRVLMPAYLNYHETEEHFSTLFAKYVSESAEPEYHRALLSFQNYDAIKQQIAEGTTPKITYKKLNGETVTLSIYPLCNTEKSVSDTLWIFAKK